MLFGPASICLRRPSTSPLGKSYATPSGRKHASHAKTGPSGTRSPHSRQESATAGPKSVDVVGGASVSTAMWRGLSPHLPHDAFRRGTELAPSPPATASATASRSRPVEGLPGRQRAVPSVPLDELYGPGLHPGICPYCISAVHTLACDGHARC